MEIKPVYNENTANDGNLVVEKWGNDRVLVSAVEPGVMRSSNVFLTAQEAKSLAHKILEALEP